jgi:hypothetical protein
LPAVEPGPNAVVGESAVVVEALVSLAQPLSFDSLRRGDELTEPRPGFGT